MSFFESENQIDFKKPPFIVNPSSIYIKNVKTGRGNRRIYNIAQSRARKDIHVGMCVGVYDMFLDTVTEIGHIISIRYKRCNNIENISVQLVWISNDSEFTFKSVIVVQPYKIVCGKYNADQNPFLLASNALLSKLENFRTTLRKIRYIETSINKNDIDVNVIVKNIEQARVCITNFKKEISQDVDVIDSKVCNIVLNILQTLETKSFIFNTIKDNYKYEKERYYKMISLLLLNIRVILEGYESHTLEFLFEVEKKVEKCTTDIENEIKERNTEFQLREKSNFKREIEEFIDGIQNIEPAIEKMRKLLENQHSFSELDLEIEWFLSLQNLEKNVSSSLILLGTLEKLIEYKTESSRKSLQMEDCFSVFDTQTVTNFIPEN